MRDTRADYRRAYLEEHEAYRRAGRDADADAVAAILRDHFDTEVATSAPELVAPEQAAAEALPENTAAPKPAARRPRAKKTE